MSIALSAQKANYTRRRKIVRMTGTPSGNYTTGGDPLDFTNIANPYFEGNVGFNQVPSIDDLKVVRVPDGYTAQIVAGTGSTLATCAALKVFTADNVELAAGAYPAGLTASSFLIEGDVSTWGN